MPRYPLKERLTPYQVLAFLLYTDLDMIERLPSGRVRVITGPAARLMNVTNNNFHRALEWLLAVGIVTRLRRGKRRGTVLVDLARPLTQPAETLAEGTEPEDLDPRAGTLSE